MEWTWPPSARGWRLITAGVALSSIVVVAVAPPAMTAVDLPAMHPVLDSVGLVVSLLVTFLLGGRYLRTGRLDDLLLVLGLACGAATNLVSTTVTVANLNGVVLSAWAPALGQLASGTLLALGSLCPPRVLGQPPTAVLRRAAFACLGFAGAILMLSIVLPHLPTLAPASAVPGVPPLLDGPPGFLVMQLFMAIALALAALGFSRKADAGDGLAHWLALSCMLGAAGRIDYYLYPSLYTQWVSIGDLLRLGRFGVLLCGAALEIRGYWRSQTTAAVLEERRRMARDLHDGLAQELAYISLRARRADVTDPAMRQISAAADRALLDSRRAIAALSLPIDERFDVVLGRIAEETAARAGARVELDLDAVEVEREQAEALIRIVSEAVLNATRHGGADRVVVELDKERGVQLRVRDNGNGFDPEEASARRAPGFGLVSMRERAEAVGGEFSISSAPGGGALVEVRLP